MQRNVNGKIIETDEQGFLRDLEDWNEDFARDLQARRPADAAARYVKQLRCDR